MWQDLLEAIDALLAALCVEAGARSTAAAAVASIVTSAPPFAAHAVAAGARLGSGWRARIAQSILSQLKIPWIKYNGTYL